MGKIKKEIQRRGFPIILVQVVFESINDQRMLVVYFPVMQGKGERCMAFSPYCAPTHIADEICSVMDRDLWIAEENYKTWEE